MTGHNHLCDTIVLNFMKKRDGLYMWSVLEDTSWEHMTTLKRRVQLELVVILSTQRQQYNSIVELGLPIALKTHLVLLWNYKRKIWISNVHYESFRSSSNHAHWLLLSYVCMFKSQMIIICINLMSCEWIMLTRIFFYVRRACAAKKATKLIGRKNAAKDVCNIFLGWIHEGKTVHMWT